MTIEEKWQDMCSKTGQDPNDMSAKTLFMGGAAAACTIAAKSEEKDKLQALKPIMDYIGKFTVEAMVEAMTKDIRNQHGNN